MMDDKEWILYIIVPFLLGVSFLLISLAWVNPPSIKTEMDNNTKEVSLACVEIIDNYESEKDSLERQLYLCNYKVDTYYNDCGFYCFDITSHLKDDIDTISFLETCLNGCLNKELINDE